MAVNNQSPSRSKFDDKTKREVVLAILSGKLALQDAAKEHHLQSYQLHAWIGQVAMERPELVFEALEVRFGKMHAETGTSIPGIALPGNPTITPGDLTTAVMAEYLRRVLYKS